MASLPAIAVSPSASLVPLSCLVHRLPPQPAAGSTAPGRLRGHPGPPKNASQTSIMSPACHNACLHIADVRYWGLPLSGSRTIIGPFTSWSCKRAYLQLRLQLQGARRLTDARGARAIVIGDTSLT